MKYFALASALVLAVSGSYYVIYQHGKDVVRAEWEEDTAKRNKAMQDLQGRYDVLSLDHKAKSETYARSLEEQKNAYETRLGELGADTDRRLRLSETRASVYQRQAQGGEAERRNLASHAAKLDRALEEGIEVVGELQELVGLRDHQLTQLGKQILADRLLLEEIDRHEQ